MKSINNIAFGLRKAKNVIKSSMVRGARLWVVVFLAMISSNVWGTTTSGPVTLPAGSTSYSANDWRNHYAPTAYPDPELSQTIVISSNNGYNMKFYHAADYGSANGLQLERANGAYVEMTINSSRGVDIVIGYISNGASFDINLTGASDVTAPSSSSATTTTIKTSSTSATLKINGNSNNVVYISYIKITAKNSGTITIDCDDCALGEHVTYSTALTETHTPDEVYGSGDWADFTKTIKVSGVNMNPCDMSYYDRMWYEFYNQSSGWNDDWVFSVKASSSSNTYSEITSSTLSETLTISYLFYEEPAPGEYSADLFCWYWDSECENYVEFDKTTITLTVASACTSIPTFTTTGTPTTTSNLRSGEVTVNNVGLSSLGTGGCTIISYGYCWNTSSNPTLSNSNHEVGSTIATGTAFGNYTITGLNANTDYYIRPYATNGSVTGTAYGPEVHIKTLQKYAITYNKNDGSGTSATEYKDHGIAYTISSDKFSRDLYSLKKWNTDPDGTSGVTYEKGDSYETNAALTLYAVWGAQECEITLNRPGTQTGTRKVTATYNSPVPAINTLPTWDLYNFAGYYTGENGSGTQLTDEEGVWIASVPGYTDASKNWIYTGTTLTLYANRIAKSWGNARAWCPEPELILTGTAYVTSMYHADNGGMIRGTAQLTLTGINLAASQTVTLTSNNADVYFSTSTYENIKRGAENQPKTSLTFSTDANGKLNGSTGYTIYVHFMPSSLGEGSVSDVTVTATYAVPDPDLTSTTHVYVRSMPAQFAIATKVGSTWYALPANIGSAGNPTPVRINVNESSWTASGPSTVAYTMWPVHTTSSVTPAPSYVANGDHWRLVGNSDKALWASPSENTYTLNNNATVTDVTSTATTSYEWKISTTPLVALDPTSSTWKYYIQSDQTNNTNYLNIKKNDIIWGAYNAGYELSKDMYLLPLTTITPFEYDVVEWYPTKMLIETDATISSPSITIDGNAVSSPTVTGKGTKLYEIGNLPLAANPAKTMVITNSGAVCTKTIPIIISGATKSISDEPFSTLGKAIYNYADLVVRDGAVLTVNGSETDNTFQDVIIYPNSKISVPALNANSAANKFDVHSLTFFGGIDEIYDGSSYTIDKYGVPQLSLKGSFGSKTVSTIDYVMRVDASQMYSLTVPYDVNLSDITYWDGTAIPLSTKLWISAYDGQARANRESKSWVYEDKFESKFGEAKLKAGVGYTISADKQESNHTYTILRMPMTSNVAATTTEVAKSVSVTAFDNNKGVTVSDNHKGWNLVGNPYMSAISGRYKGGADSTKLVVGYLKETGTGPWEWVTDDYRYVTIPFDDGSDYYQERFSKATLLPFKNFFVQVNDGGTLSFALASRQNIARRNQTLIASDREVEFEIELSNNARTDHMGLLIGDKFTTEYEINADLEKMTGSMSVYTIFGGYKLAYAAMSPSDAALYIPVGYIADKAGEYTFSLADDVNTDDFEHVWLTDYDQNRVVDLLNGAYKFTTVQGTNETRFALNTVLKEVEDVPSEIDISDVSSDEPIKFIYQDKMYILNKGVIYDATGKKVK